MGKTQDHRSAVEQWLAVGGWWELAVGPESSCTKNGPTDFVFFCIYFFVYLFIFIHFPGCKFRFFLLWILWSGGEGALPKKLFYFRPAAQGTAPYGQSG